MGGAEKQGLYWTAALHVEGWAGELRVNLIRLIAIAGFYGHHLLNRYALGVALPPGYHAAATGIAIAWSAGALALHIGLTRRWNPPYLKYAAAGFDALMITSLLLLSDGPKSPLVSLLFLLVATAPMRLDLRFVWTAAALALLSYAFVCGHARWMKPEWRIPRTQQVIVALALAASGVLAGQAVRQARRLARDFADRVLPGEGP